MPPERRGRNDQPSLTPAAGGDRLGALPDDVLHLVLSFLPAEEAVRTCVLARRWLNLWKSATALHIDRDLDGPESMKALRASMEHLLLLRGGSPLDRFDLSLNFRQLDGMLDAMTRVKLWIRHILMCKVRVMTLRIHSVYMFPGFHLGNLNSNHIRKLHLSGIHWNAKLLDFSCCPGLEVLEADRCTFTYARTISSQSLKCLSIGSHCIFREDARVHIYAPNLCSLRLEVETNRIPMLTKMPLLMEAFVELSLNGRDACDNSALFGDCEYDDCFNCYGVAGDTDNCVLLQGLSKLRIWC